jgi:hypothetical protein
LNITALDFFKILIANQICKTQSPYDVIVSLEIMPIATNRISFSVDTRFKKSVHALIANAEVVLMGPRMKLAPRTLPWP